MSLDLRQASTTELRKSHEAGTTVLLVAGHQIDRQLELLCCEQLQRRTSTQ